MAAGQRNLKSVDHSLDGKLCGWALNGSFVKIAAPLSSSSSSSPASSSEPLPSLTRRLSVTSAHRARVDEAVAALRDSDEAVHRLAELAARCITALLEATVRTQGVGGL
jgi:hypothetical protein